MNKQCPSVLCCLAAPHHLRHVAPPFSFLKPPAQLGRRVRRGRARVENGALSDWGAHVVEVDAQHDEYGEEGEAEAEASDGAVQSEAEPVDEPAEKETTS